MVNGGIVKDMDQEWQERECVWCGHRWRPRKAGGAKKCPRCQRRKIVVRADGTDSPSGGLVVEVKEGADAEVR